MVKNLPAMQETQVWSLIGEDALEKEMTTHSSNLAWKIPWTEESGRLQSKGSQSDTTWQLNHHNHIFFMKEYFYLKEFLFLFISGNGFCLVIYYVLYNNNFFSLLFISTYIVYFFITFTFNHSVFLCFKGIFGKQHTVCYF